MSVWLVISGVIICFYVLVMLWLAFGISKTNNFKESSTKPSVSIIVSLRNESHNVDALLNGLKSLKYPKSQFEIILVNDNSTDSTYQDLLKYQSFEVTILNNSGEGKKKAIEAGIAASKHEWIALTDADCKVPEQWIDSMVKSISETTKMVLGPVFISNTKGFLNSFQAIEFLGLQGATAGSAGMGNPVSANAANMMFRKDVFEELNPYADNYHLKTGDDQFLLMAVSEQYPSSVVYSKRKDSIVRTNPVSTWNHYINQRIRWASKGSSYSQLSPKIVGMIVFFTSLVFPVLLIGGWSFMDMELVVVLVSFKVISDVLVVFTMRAFAEISFNPFHYLLSIILYPFVVVGSVVGGLLK